MSLAETDPDVGDELDLELNTSIEPGQSVVVTVFYDSQYNTTGATSTPA